MANVITAMRIVCTLILAFCSTFSKLFYAVYIIGGISDVLDGITARHFGKETKFGAKMDAIADILFAAVVLIKVLKTVYVPLWLMIWIVCIAIIKGMNIISGLVIRGHFVSEHTMMNKICGVVLFAIPFCIGRFSWQSVAVLIILSCVMATVAAIQEGYFIRTGKEIL